MTILLIYDHYWICFYQGQTKHQDEGIVPVKEHHNGVQKKEKKLLLPGAIA